MSEEIVRIGDKVHIMTRRLFPDDLRRHFIGEVSKALGHVCVVQGYAFIFHSGSGEYQRRPDRRTRIFSLADASHIVNILPPELDLASLEYRKVDGRLVVTDTKGFSLDVNEFGSSA